MQKFFCLGGFDFRKFSCSLDKIFDKCDGEGDEEGEEERHGVPQHLVVEMMMIM